MCLKRKKKTKLNWQTKTMTKLHPVFVFLFSSFHKTCHLEDDEESYVPLNLDVSKNESHGAAAALVAAAEIAAETAAETREYFEQKNKHLQNKKHDVKGDDDTQADPQTAPPLPILQQLPTNATTNVRAGTGNNNNNNNNNAGRNENMENGDNVRESQQQQPTSIKMGNKLTQINYSQFVRQLRNPLQWNQNHDLMAETDMIPQLPEPTGNWAIDELNFTKIFERLQESMDTLAVL